MLKPESHSKIIRFWSEELGIREFPSHDILIQHHQPHRLNALGNRIFCLCTNDWTVVTAPKEVAWEIEAKLDEFKANPFKLLEDLFGNRGQTIGGGPAFISYKDNSVEQPCSTTIISADDNRIEFLKVAQPLDWNHFGLTPESIGLFAQIEEDRLAGLAHYKVWGNIIAHIGVIVAQDARGRGVGRKVVSAAINHALGNGLIPQYRTLYSNQSSLGLSKSLDFRHFGDSLVIKYGG